MDKEMKEYIISMMTQEVEECKDRLLMNERATPVSDEDIDPIFEKLSGQLEMLVKMLVAFSTGKTYEKVSRNASVTPYFMSDGTVKVVIVPRDPKKVIFEEYSIEEYISKIKSGEIKLR